MIDKNSIIQLPISVASGFNNRYVNGNTYTTNGAELIITATPIQSKKFTWNLSTNWSTNIRKLTEIYGGQEKYGDLKLGDRADAMYATEWEKTPDGQLILDSNGMPTQSAFKMLHRQSGSGCPLRFAEHFQVRSFYSKRGHGRSYRRYIDLNYNPENVVGRKTSEINHVPSGRI